MLGLKLNNVSKRGHWCQNGYNHFSEPIMPQFPDGSECIYRTKYVTIFHLCIHTQISVMREGRKIYKEVYTCWFPKCIQRSAWINQLWNILPAINFRTGIHTLFSVSSDVPLRIRQSYMIKYRLKDIRGTDTRLKSNGCLDNAISPLILCKCTR